MKRKTPLKRSPAPRRKARPRKVHRARKAREFARAYGSKERVEWVKSLPCAVRLSGHQPDVLNYGPTENAHVGGGGAGRKAGAEHVIPLCRFHHHTLHSLGALSFQRWYRIDLLAVAEHTERAWLAYSGTTETTA